MPYSSMYCLTDSEIIYFTGNLQQHIIPLNQLSIGYVTGNGNFRSGQLEMLSETDAPMHSLYHLSAVIEKYIPGDWDWVEQLKFIGLVDFREQYGPKAYLREKGLFVYPEFTDDYSAFEFEVRVDKWLEERGYPRAYKDYEKQLEQEIQTYVFEKSKTDFIQLTPEQIQLIQGEL